MNLRPARPDPRDHHDDPELDPVASDEPEDGLGPDVIIAPPRRNGSSARFLPPILIVMLGFLFLAYRAGSSNWRGIAPLLEASWSWQWPRWKSPAAPAPAPSQTPPRALALAPAAPPADPEKVADVKDAPPAKAADAPPEGADWKDIQAEAEKTKQRIAELEKLKEEEARRLAQTEDERREEARRDQFNRRFKPLDPQQLARMEAAQREILRKQMAWMAEIQRKQMAEMQAMQDRFLNGNGGFPGMGRMPPPMIHRFGPDPVPAPPAPRFNGNGNANRNGNNARRNNRNVVTRERTIRNGDGVTVIRESHGPDGVSTFEMTFRGNGNGNLNGLVIPPAAEEPPPPPRPGKVFD